MVCWWQTFGSSPVVYEITKDVVDHSGSERRSPAMTDIFVVSIDEIEGPTLRGRVHLINPDVPFVSLEPGFPLALLVDAWFHLANGYLRNESLWDRRCPFSVVRGKEIATSMRLKDDFQELYDLMRRKRVQGSDSGPAEFYRRATDIVISNDSSPIHNVPDWSEVVSFDDPDEPWEPGEREEFASMEGSADLSAYRVWALVRTRPRSAYPYVDITATVSDEGYLEHMAGGMRWGTTHTGYGY
jgi:hypothetical protein